MYQYIPECRNAGKFASFSICGILLEGLKVPSKTFFGKLCKFPVFIKICSLENMIIVLFLKYYVFQMLNVKYALLNIIRNRYLKYLLMDLICK